MAKHIVSHPGGVVLHLSDGSSEYFAYGVEVDPDTLADYQKKTLGNVTDDRDRSAYTRETPQVERDAHRQAAYADGSQVNSTSDPVPGNYGELSEEEAAQLVMAINDPQIQARLLLHERLHHGSRQMVIDAGGQLAKALAEVEYTNAVGGLTNFAQTPAPDREREVERAARRQAASGEPEDLHKLKREDLDSRATALGVENPEDLPNKDAVVEAIEAAQVSSGSTGRTPAPTS